MWIRKIYNEPKGEDEESRNDAIIWTVSCMVANIAICVLGWWRCFANNYLHWAAIITWLLLNVQGNYRKGQKVEFERMENLSF